MRHTVISCLKNLQPFSSFLTNINISFVLFFSSRCCHRAFPPKVSIIPTITPNTLMKKPFHIFLFSLFMLQTFIQLFSYSIIQLFSYSIVSFFEIHCLFWHLYRIQFLYLFHPYRSGNRRVYPTA